MWEYGEAIGGLFKAMAWAILLLIPLSLLGLWKLVEIVVWFWQHVRWAS
jgi:hypothetical protein